MSKIIIGSPHTEEQAWGDEGPYQVAKTIDENDLKTDPFVLARKKTDMSFLDVLLIPLIEKHLSEDPQWKGREENIPDQAKYLAMNLRGFTEQ